MIVPPRLHRPLDRTSLIVEFNNDSFPRVRRWHTVSVFTPRESTMRRFAISATLVLLLGASTAKADDLVPPGASWNCFTCERLRSRGA